jgi:hypothetical protein
MVKNPRSGDGSGPIEIGQSPQTLDALTGSDMYITRPADQDDPLVSGQADR